MSVSAYVAVQVVLVRGASTVAGQDTVPTFGSFTATPWSVTLPSLVTRNVYGSVAPTALSRTGPAVLTIVTCGAAGIAVTAAPDPMAGGPCGESADATAPFTTTPRSTSSCVRMYVPVHVVVPPGATDAGGHVTDATFGSFTVMLCRVTLPVLVTRNVYVIGAPAL